MVRRTSTGQYAIERQAVYKDARQRASRVGGLIMLLGLGAVWVLTSGQQFLIGAVLVIGLGLIGIALWHMSVMRRWRREWEAGNKEDALQ
jgi:hypothetical protein